MTPKKPESRETKNHSVSQDTGQSKNRDLETNRERSDGQFLTTNEGMRINDDQNSLKAGERGPTLLEDFQLREKITHFDHERIPERIVHARGNGAHGYFQVYESLARYTSAKFLQDPALKTPVFVRFSTVAGSRGSSDLARDVRGFATKFYTQEGNYDLVGNNMPVFFIQDAIKFPDLIHSVKPEPHNEIPQAASAHDTFWDFISLTPESTHMVMWAMSDRAIPRSLRMMEGFGVHTFKLINDQGQAHFVKFHWKPLLGVHSITWDEAQKISGKDPDFHRRDLWEAIENGDFPQWELGLQLIPEADEHKFDFDLLDPTKLVPEELVPVKRVGKLVLDRNPDNFFAETEQIAFNPGHIVPGIDFSNDPLLAGRLFSYTDTQLIRLGGPNFAEIPINRPVAPLHNNQRDGFMRQQINVGRTAYGPNSLNGNFPAQAKRSEGGFVTHTQRVDGHKIRARSPSFVDHYSQARLFWNSQSAPEKDHLVAALRFELGMLQSDAVRERMLFQLKQVDGNLASRVAEGLGMPVPTNIDGPANQSIPADTDPATLQSRPASDTIGSSDALSMANTVKDTIQTRQIAILAADGVDGESLAIVKDALMDAGAQTKLIAPRLGTLKTVQGETLKIDVSLHNAASVLFDAVYVPCGPKSVGTLKSHPAALHFLNEAYKHCKPIAASGQGIRLLHASALGQLGVVPDDPQASSNKHGLVYGPQDKTAEGVQHFIDAIARHRHWGREKHDEVPA